MKQHIKIQWMPIEHAWSQRIAWFMCGFAAGTLASLIVQVTR